MEPIDKNEVERNQGDERRIHMLEVIAPRPVPLPVETAEICSDDVFIKYTGGDLGDPGTNLKSEAIQ